MEIHVTCVRGIAVVTVPGEDLDTGNAADFKLAMAPVIDANTQLVIDLSRLRFVDSSGLGAFISFLRKLTAKGGELKLCGLSKPVRAVFELVRMHRVFEILPTTDDAVRAFAAR